MRYVFVSLIWISLLQSSQIVAVEQDAQTPRIEELTIQLEELSRKYDLAVQGLKSGATGVGLAWSFAILLLVAMTVATLRGKTLMSGWVLASTTTVLVAGLVIYFAFIFDREAEIRAELSETNKSIQLATAKCP